MFDSKVKTLIASKQSTEKTTSAFVQAALKNGAEVLSPNGAKQYSTSGHSIVDQFNSLGMYKAPRTYADISRDASILWGEDKWSAVAFTIFVRMISRQTMYQDGTMTATPQKGGELKHEGIMRFLWIYFKDKKIFWDNIGLFISAGSWKDIFTMLSYDLTAHGWDGRKLDWKKFGELILSGLENSNTSELVKKYLPQIKATSALKTLDAQADTVIGKWICSLLFGNKENAGSTYKQYRKLKSSGTAHEWQKLISQKQFDRIDFSKVHGRALSKLVQGKFLTNHGLNDKYAAFIEAPETETVKFTGFVYELFSPLVQSNSFRSKSLGSNQENTINKQFAELVRKGGESPRTNLIVVRDTSSSMTSYASGTNMSSHGVAKAMALYFSEFLTGPFSNAWIEFNSKAKLHVWKGSTPVEKFKNDMAESYGSTNFQAVIDLFASMKRNGVDESEFPSGILCISDGCFNATQLGKTNVEAAKDKLRDAGFSKEYVDEFVIILWNIPNDYYGSAQKPQFETFGDVKNVFYMSGYSPTIVSFLGGKIKTAKELVDEALNQELLLRIKA